MGQHKPPFVAFTDIDPGDNISDQRMQRISKGLEAFALCIDRIGLIHALVVSEGGPSRTTGQRRCTLEVGFRRYFAIKLLREGKVPGQKTTARSWAEVPVRYVKGNTQDRDVRNLVENLHREDLDVMDEALAMEAYLEKHKVSQAQLARDISMSEPYVSQRLALLRDTVEEVRDALRAGDITPTQAREISAAPKEKQPGILAFLKEQKSHGAKVTAADVRDEVAAGGRVRKKTGRKAIVVDQEKVQAAKDAYADKKLAPRPRPALLECLGTLVIRERRNSTERTTHQIAVLEYVLGIRDSL